MLGRGKFLLFYFRFSFFVPIDREALNILRYEHGENKRKEQEHRRLLMMQKIADLRQFKHTQIANFQENYFQRLLDEEREMTERLKKQKFLKYEQFGS
jgi:hypothetical protein